MAVPGARDRFGETAHLVRRRWSALLRGVARLVLVVALVAALGYLGHLALYRPAVALGVAVLVVVGVLAATDALAFAVVTVLGVWVIARTGAGGVDLSGSDALLVIGTVVAFPYVPWANRDVRLVLGMILAFQAVLLLTVVVHPTTASLFEWGHRFFLTGGSVVVGAAVAARGRTRAALGAFVVLTTAMAAVVVVSSAANGFAPTVSVLGFHKNFIGSMILVSLAVSHLAPSSTGLSRHQLTAVKGACAAGLLASQSRGAIVALLVALIVTTVRSPSVRRRSAPLVVVLIPLALFAFFSIRAQVEPSAASSTSSVTERERFAEQGLEAWRESPIVGQGMRFFESGEFPLGSDPHNVVVASLSETGIVGLAALLGLLAMTVRVTWRLPGGLALAALAAVVARFTHGLFDIYWVAGTQALPWMIVGMAVGGSVICGTDQRSASRLSEQPASIRRHSG